MTYRWQAEIHVWPHSSGRGVDTDQREAGDRKRTVEITAGSIDEALKMAKFYQAGVETGPMVWRAPIFKIEMIR